MDCVVNPLLSAFFNVAARNIALVLSRREVGKELTLKMVKELKKKIETQVVKYKKTMTRTHRLGRASVASRVKIE